jgi:N-acetylmuramoyl-L-alanine amidase
VLLSGTITDVPEFSESMAISQLSPNYSSRDGARISQIVVHHTNGTVESAVSTLRSPAARVSAHLLVSREGKVVRLVSDEMKAWHAVDANRTALGVEIEALEQAKGLTQPQERILLSVLRYWSKRHSIPLEMIMGHRSVVATLCPSWIWPKDADLTAWLTKATPFLK